jgi:hypothetical protein
MLKGGMWSKTGGAHCGVSAIWQQMCRMQLLASDAVPLASDAVASTVIPLSYECAALSATEPAGGDRPSGTQQQQQQPGTGSYQGTAAAGQPSAAAGGQGRPYQQQQQWQQQQQGKAQAPWDGWMGQQQQDDVVDVFYGRGMPKQQ